MAAAGEVLEPGGQLPLGVAALGGDAVKDADGHPGVGAGVAQGVVAGAAVQPVETGAAGPGCRRRPRRSACRPQPRRSGCRCQRPASSRVVAGPAVQDVVAVSPFQGVVAAPAVQRVVAAPPSRPVGGGCGVVAAAPNEVAAMMVSSWAEPVMCSTPINLSPSASPPPGQVAAHDSVDAMRHTPMVTPAGECGVVSRWRCRPALSRVSAPGTSDVACRCSGSAASQSVVARPAVNKVSSPCPAVHPVVARPAVHPVVAVAAVQTWSSPAIAVQRVVARAAEHRLSLPGTSPASSSSPVAARRAGRRCRRRRLMVSYAVAALQHVAAAVAAAQGVVAAQAAVADLAGPRRW